jgi:3-deoxy-7-phosphoheptulonate synthase
VNIPWGKTSWRNFPIQQQPDWPDLEKLNVILTKLNSLPSLVFSGETRLLRQELKKVSKGEAFFLQVGNCSESFSDCNGPKIHNFLRVLLQMAMVVAFKSGKEVIKIGRVAGQYAKPRSSAFEMVNGEELPCYKGDNVNDYTPTLEARRPDADRLMEGYYRSAATLNLIRAFTQGGYNDIRNISDWKEHFFSDEISHLDHFQSFEKDLSYALNHGYRMEHSSASDIVYISHEALLLPYEEAFVRVDTTTGDY